MVRTIRKKVELNEEDARWFEETYPSGSYSWLFGIFLASFRNLHNHSTPATVINQAAAEVKQIIEEENEA